MKHVLFFLSFWAVLPAVAQTDTLVSPVDTAAEEDQSPQPAAMTTNHPLLRHKKKKGIRGDFKEENGMVAFHLTNNTQIWSEDQKKRKLNTEQTNHSQLRDIQATIELNNRQIEEWKRDIFDKQECIEKKNIENEKLIALFNEVEGAQRNEL